MPVVRYAPRSGVWVGPPAPASSLPAAPTSVSAVATNAQAVISFVAPPGPVDSYRVTPSAAPTTPVAGTASPITVTGLTNGTPYTFRVAAHNSVGWGPNSSSSNSVTPTVPTGGETTITTAYVTGYTYFDNTPPGSAEISNPILHSVAGGTGTYADPITIAVGWSTATGQDVLDYPAGTKMYLPHLRRYFIVEDECGDNNPPQTGPCHNLSTAPGGATTWVDIWVGGAAGDNSSSVDACANAITDIHTIIVNPVSTYPVVSGAVYHGGACTQIY